jgi:dephospho-CoA kinase
MIKIGLTGGIGSGKTTVSKIFQTLGVPVYFADDRSKYLLNNIPLLVSSIKRIFGEQAYENNELNRKYIASIVFNDKSKLSLLNNLVHPAVEQDFKEWCSQHSKKPYIVKEAAILFESNAFKLMNKNILIDAPEETRISRVIARDNSSRDQIEKRISNQWTTDKLKALADFIVINDDKTLILPQILEIDKKIRTEWQSLVNG